MQSNQLGDTALLYLLKHAEALPREEVYTLGSRMIKQGAMLNVQNKLGLTPLMIVCQHSQEAIGILIAGTS